MRPEHTAPPEIFYNVDEAQKYSRNTRVMEIQATMSERAIEMLNLKENELVCAITLSTLILQKLEFFQPINITYLCG